MADAKRTGSARRSAKSLVVIAFLAAFGSVAIGFIAGNRWVLPIANTILVYPFYIKLILAGERRRAVALALVWAIFMSEAMVAGTCLFPERAKAIVISGAEYKGEMFSWISTGEGKESTPREFIVEHAREFAIFAGVGIVTAGLGAIFMGAVLLNFMNFYVGALILASANPLATALVAWQPYAVVRVVGYIIFATALAEASLGMATKWRARWSRVVAYGTLGFALVALDVIIKWAIAPLWGKLLRMASGL